MRMGININIILIFLNPRLLRLKCRLLLSYESKPQYLTTMSGMLKSDFLQQQVNISVFSVLIFSMNSVFHLGYLVFDRPYMSYLIY